MCIIAKKSTHLKQWSVKTSALLVNDAGKNPDVQLRLCQDLYPLNYQDVCGTAVGAGVARSDLTWGLTLEFWETLH